MVMQEMLVMTLDGSDNVPFHDLHVIDIVQQPDSRRIDLLAHGNSPSGRVALVAVVVHTAIQQLDYEIDASILGLF